MLVVLMAARRRQNGDPVRSLLRGDIPLCGKPGRSLLGGSDMSLHSGSGQTWAVALRTTSINSKNKLCTQKQIMETISNRNIIY